MATGPAFTNVDTVPSGGFFQQVNFKGAFGTNMWLDGWSYLSDNGFLPAADILPTASNTLPRFVTSDTTLSSSMTWYMTGQVFVKAGATLTIEAGTTIRSYRQDTNGSAPTLVIEQGAKIMAEGTAASPITFTTVLPQRLLPLRGTWGGLIILGQGIITGGGTNDIEGLESGLGTYGGSDDADNSGTPGYYHWRRNQRYRGIRKRSRYLWWFRRRRQLRNAQVRARVVRRG
ncbi:hypothetical protein AAMO2058_001652900 [Amorphochlora amoebiformis]